jgi:hypothetical protein
VFCTTDAAYTAVFVEVTPATATAQAALSRLIATVEALVPAECDAELDVSAVRCAGREWWTRDSLPAAGPGRGARELWRFDVRDALTLTPAIPFAVDDRPGCPPEALDALEEHWRAGRIDDADHEHLQVLAQAQAAALERYAARRDAAPAGAPRVELRDDERYAVLALMRHVVRLLVPLLGNEIARDLLAGGLADLETQAGDDAARAIAELAHDLDELPHASDPSPHHR